MGFAACLGLGLSIKKLIDWKWSEPQPTAWSADLQYLTPLELLLFSSDDPH